MNSESTARLTDAQRRLVEENVSLVGYTLARYVMGAIPRGEREDFVSIGYIELCKAAAYYAPEKGSSGNYASPPSAVASRGSFNPATASSAGTTRCSPWMA